MNKQYMQIKKRGLLILFMAIIAILNACKTEYENLLRPYNGIERFTIAGYGDVDSLDAVIANNQITIYWNPDAERPEKIAPTIKVSEGASISPASGTAVAFAETTKYTVTAEDGTQTIYTLKPVYNIPVPSLFSVPALYSWSSATPINIVGQYFMSTGNVKDIKVYIQRLKDGVEFDIPYDTASVTTNNIKAYLPKLTADLDTGAHRLYVKVGDFKSSFSNIFLTQPYIKDMVESVSFDRYGNLPLGNELTFKWNIKEEWQEAFKRYYAMNQLTRVTLGLQQITPGRVINGQGITIDSKYVNIAEDGTIKFTMSPDFFTTYKHYRVFSFSVTYGGSFETGYTGGFGGTSYTIPSPLLNTVLETILEETRYATFQFSHEGKQIKLGEEMTLDVTFDNAADEAVFTTMSGVSLGLKDASTGVYSVYNIPAANRTISGNRITFTIPTTATAVANKELVIIGATFRGTTALNNVVPRKVLTNTSISN